MHFEKKLESELKYDGKIVKLYKDTVLLENGRRISAFAAQLPFMRGTALARA